MREIDPIERIANLIQGADAIIIGAGAGLSTAAGLNYGGKRFIDNFPEYMKRYGMRDMYSAGFYPFETQEERWAYWSRHILLNRYEFPAGKPYQDLLNIVSEKEYFVLTTNVDHQFFKAGFEPERIFPTQGDYGLFQCERACHSKLYDNEEIVRKMAAVQKDCKIPTELVPKCPVCGRNMAINIRCDQYFVEDSAWEEACVRYEQFLEKNKSKNIVFLELGVGMNTPGIIKYPFWRMTDQFPHATYVCLNLMEAYAPEELREKSVCVDCDLAEVMFEIKEKL